MKVGKYINNEMVFAECEQGVQVDSDTAVEQLYAQGYKDICEIKRPSETAVCTYQDYGTCYIQIWTEPEAIMDEFSTI